ncbi:TadG family pilus assembly protein [Stakelama sediminis]|uniref:Putative membrane protein n=1 Tax=Stakelama sediminis TaxID=463200 RepID=A0A840Z2U2_9SPHN|nr:TadG family pilus assembly protein [Stakelama sediminis]MBB5720074.1 putative membrane protein [Stakelama sediminis]
MKRLYARLRHDRRGNAAILIGAALPMLLGAGALAVDLGSAQLESRRLQGIADSAALAAATDAADAQERAQDMVDASGWDRKIDVVTTSGTYDRSDSDIATRFSSGGVHPNAVKVTLTTQSPTFLARFFGKDSITVVRKATATRANLASFSIGTRLLKLDGGLLNAYLSALTGSQVSLSVMDYQALASANVDLLGFLKQLNTQANLKAVSFNDILKSSVSGPQALAAVGGALPAGTAQNALTRLASAASGTGKPLSSLIDLGPLGTQDDGGGALVRVNALSLATALLELANDKRQVAFDLSAAVPGIAQSRVWLAIGQRPESSPWIAITDSGNPVIRTAQARLYIENRTGSTALPGLSTLASIDLPIYAELASGEARLDRISCDGNARHVTIDARSGLGKAAIGTIDTGTLDDFSREPAISDAHLINALLLKVDGSATIDLGGDEPWHTLRFNDAQIADGDPQTVSGSTAVQGIVSSLASRIKLKVSAAGLLSVNTGPIGNAVASQLTTVAPALDGLVNLATGALGVHYGQADVWVTGVRCGQPVLVS